MNRTTLKAAGEVLWGPRYVQEMGRQLGVSPRTAQRWDSGETAIPDGVRDRLQALLAKRRERLDKVMGLLAKTGA